VINRNRLIQQADADGVPAQTVERDYVLTHCLAAIAARDAKDQLAFKGGTALRLCYFEDYRYSADLDFSLLGDLDRAGAIEVILAGLTDCRADLGLPHLTLDDFNPPRIEYVGPLGHKARTLKLDLADDEHVEDTNRRKVAVRYADQRDAECLVYTLREVAAEKLRCVIQRLQCRDLFDLHELFVERGLSVDDVWPLFERKTLHRQLDPLRFGPRLDERMVEYERRWVDELIEYLPGEPPHFNGVERRVRRALRSALQK
jgi:predicted nucleotidyltransferase component of viral defense system